MQTSVTGMDRLSAAAPPLLIADGDIPSTAILARALREGCGGVETRASANLFGADVRDRPVFISRLCHPSYDWLPRYLAERGVRYAYFLDDNFWELTPAVDVHLAEFFGHRAVRTVLDRFVSNAAVTLVMSRRLGAYIAQRHPEARVEYIVPGVDVARVTQLAATVPRVAKAPGEFRVAYPTSRRENVAALVVSVVEALARRHGGRVRFEFVGWAPDAVIGLPGVRLHPHIDSYERYLEHALSRDWDVGIAPLAGEPFETYKTQVKYREYGVCGVAGVYSHVPPFTDYVHDGVSGLLVANTSDAWVDAIERLLAQPDLRAGIARHAHDDVVQHFDQSLTGAQLRAVAESLLHSAADGMTDARGLADVAR